MIAIPRTLFRLVFCNSCQAYICAILLLQALPTRLPAAEVAYGNWQPLGNGVSVSFAQVSASTWTWRFRNDGADTITYMDFWYTDNTGRNYDVFPGSLRPGRVFGGWGSFTASSSPTIQVKSIQRGNSTGESGGGQSDVQQGADYQFQQGILQQQQQALQQQQQELAVKRQELQAQYEQKRQQLLTAQEALKEQRQQAAVNEHVSKAQSYEAAGQTAASTIQGIGQVLLNKMQQDADERRAQREQEQAERKQERMEAELREQEAELKQQQEDLEKEFRQQMAALQQNQAELSQVHVYTPAQTYKPPQAPIAPRLPEPARPLFSLTSLIGNGDTPASRDQAPAVSTEQLADFFFSSPNPAQGKPKGSEGPSIDSLNGLIFGKGDSQAKDPAKSKSVAAQPKNQNDFYDSILSPSKQ